MCASTNVVLLPNERMTPVCMACSHKGEPSPLGPAEREMDAPLLYIYKASLDKNIF
jgi:hypothetical protein